MTRDSTSGRADGAGELTVTAGQHDAAETIAGGPLEDEGPGSLRPFRNGVIASFGLVLVIMLLLCGYSSAFGRTVPNHIPVAVVAPQAVDAELESSSALAVQRAGSLAAARTLVSDREAYGAIAVTGAHSATLMVASGAGHSVETVLVQLGQQLAARGGLTLTVRDIAPTSPSDPNGTVEFYAVVFLALGGAIGATVLGRVLGTVRDLRHMTRRILFLLIYTSMLSGVATFFIDPVYGALVGHTGYLFLTLWALVMTVCLAAAGVGALFGSVASIVLALTLTILGNTTAGGAIGRPLLNPFYADLTPFFPHGAGLSILRGVQYFGGRGIATGVLGLAVWAAAGLALLSIAAFRHDRAAAAGGKG